MEYIVLVAPVPALLGFLVLALAPVYLTHREVVAIGVLAGVMPAVIMTPVAAACLALECGGGLIPIMTLDFREAVIDLALQLDRLGALAGSTVSLVGAAVILYSSNYMAGVMTPDLRRFFALMNLFMASMMAMVLAADSIVFFLGWEMMGLCSFFLIAFNMSQPRSVAAGRKAFVMTRIADAALLAALLLMFIEAGSVRIETLIAATLAAEPWKPPLIASLMLVGALGKSAQLPFQTWLPSAMAGPTPVSALLHSATMVAAGVYLLARFAPLFAATPTVAAVTAGAGALTALYGAMTAVGQSDVKRLLAYSSISQIGFMILALGMGAPEAAMAHFIVHAAFKSLLFLAAGDMTRPVGGNTQIAALRGAAYWRPIAFWTYAAGAASLGGLPFVAAGWFSKETILSAVFEHGFYGQALWLVAVIAATFTGAYAFRPVFVGATPARGPRLSWGKPAVWAPLILLAAASLFGGFAVEPIVRFLGGEPHHGVDLVVYVGVAAAIGGAGFAALVTVFPGLLAIYARRRWLGTGFRIDARYHAVFVRRFRRIVYAVADGPFGEDPVGRLPVEIGRRVSTAAIAAVAPDAIDRSWMAFGRALAALWARARALQSGRLRDYALWVALGAAALLMLAWGSSWV
jgi:NADH-quinone oxidoreductase subunit L